MLVPEWLHCLGWVPAVPVVGVYDPSRMRWSPTFLISIGIELPSYICLRFSWLDMSRRLYWTYLLNRHVAFNVILHYMTTDWFNILIRRTRKKIIVDKIKIQDLLQFQKSAKFLYTSKLWKLHYFWDVALLEFHIRLFSP